MSKKKEIIPLSTRPGAVPAPPATSEDIVRIRSDWEPIWDAEFELAFEALLPKQRQFVIEYVRSGYVKREAWKRAYGTSYSEGVVDAILSKDQVQVILGRFMDWAKADLFEARTVIKEAMQAKKRVYFDGAEIDEVDDHATRLKAVEVLNKMNGANKEVAPAAPTAPTAGTIDSGFAVQFNFYLEKMGVPPMVIPDGQQIVVKAPTHARPRDLKSAYQNSSEE